MHLLKDIFLNKLLFIFQGGYVFTLVHLFISWFLLSKITQIYETGYHESWWKDEVWVREELIKCCCRLGWGFCEIGNFRIYISQRAYHIKVLCVIKYRAGVDESHCVITLRSNILHLLEYVCHHSRPIPVPCLFPHRQAWADQPVEAQLSRGAVPEPGHQCAVVHLLQMCIRLLCRSQGLRHVFQPWIRGPLGTLQGSLQRGHQTFGCSGGPRLCV